MRASEQEPALRVSRSEVLARAERGHEQLAASRAVEEQALARQRQVRAATSPIVSITAGTGPSLRASLVPGTAVESTENAYGDVGLSDLSVVVGGRVEIIQPLLTFGKIRHRLRASRFEVQARGAQTELKRDELLLEVAQLYESLLFARDVLRFLVESEHWLTRTIEDAERELAAGTGVTDQDVLMLQTALGAIRLGESQARAGRVTLNAALVAHLGYPSESVLEPTEGLLEPLPFRPREVSELIQMALRRRPELRGLSAGQAAFQALADAESAADYPDVFIVGFASGAYTPGRDLVDTRFATDPLNHFVPGLLLGARWTMQGSSADARALENRARARQLAHTELWARQALGADVTRALQELQRATRDIEETARASKVAKEWMVRASADYAIGLGDSRDVADASDSFVRLRVASFDARLRHNSALASLAKATGTIASGRQRLYPPRMDSDEH